MARYRPSAERLEQLRPLTRYEFVDDSIKVSMHFSHTQEIMRDLFAEIDALKAENEALRAGIATGKEAP